jgi:DNA-directed RNA polymerase subunit L
MKAKLASLKNNLILMIKGSESSVSVSAHGRAPSTYDIIVPGEDDTLGNVIQSHVVKNFIDDTSLLHTFGYVRSHPLEDHIILTMSINPNHKLYDSKDDVKLSGSVKVLEDAINEISSIYDEIISVSEKLL